MSYESIGVWAAEDLVEHLACLRDADELADDGAEYKFKLLEQDLTGTCEKHEDECHGDGSFKDTNDNEYKITFYEGSAVKVHLT